MVEQLLVRRVRDDKSCDDTASMTPIANLDALGFATYRESGSTVPSFNIEVYTTGVDSYTTFAFVPNAASVVDGAWQTWDAMNSSDGVWYSSHNVGSGVFNCGPFSCSASWSQITASYPNAEVVYGLGPNLGTGGTFTGNIDKFTVGVSGTTAVYDFEPDCMTTCFVDAINGNDDNTGESGDPLAMIQAGIAKVQAGGTLQVADGTYTENVVVDKSVDIEGAGPGTIVEPAVSNPNCGGAGGTSLCAGASNVFLVQADNVTIHNLVVDGDNPSLTGLAVGGADVDARNGIITNHNAGTFNGLTVDDVFVRNIYRRGIYASNGGAFTFNNNHVDKVQGEAASIGIFNFLSTGTVSNNTVSHANDAISANHSRGTMFSGNAVTTSGSGEHTDNTGDSGGGLDSITGNSVSNCTAGGFGVWTFVPYKAVTISSNTVTACDVGMATLASCNLAGNNNCPGGVVPTVTFTGNGAANGAGLYVTTNTFGFGDGDVKASADHNTFAGAQDGVSIEETGTAHAMSTVNRNSLAGPTLALHNTGATTVDAAVQLVGSANAQAHRHRFGAGRHDGRSVATEQQPRQQLHPGHHDRHLPREGRRGEQWHDDATFALVLDHPNSVPVTLLWDAVDGTATAGSDFTGATNVAVTFAPGQLFQFITVQVHGDTQVEPKEKFTVHLHGTSNAVLGNNTKHMTILNDDVGVLRTWGHNSFGQLGHGIPGGSTDSPGQVGTATNWATVSAGADQTTAIKADGTLWAWGYNAFGQLGDGTTTDRPTPVQVGTATSWASVSAGGAHTMAIKADGTLWAWGYNAFGQLGDGTTTDRPTPVQVGTDTNWTSVAAGEIHTMAIKADGTLWSWGPNSGTDPRPTPSRSVPAPTGPPWPRGRATIPHTMAIKADGTLWAWGYNGHGQLGDGTTGNGTDSPVQVRTATSWASVAAGGGRGFTMAIKADGTLWAWGYNGHGQLGDGTDTDRHSPVQVGTATNWTSVTVGYEHTEALAGS